MMAVLNIVCLVDFLDSKEPHTRHDFNEVKKDSVMEAILTLL